MSGICRIEFSEASNVKVLVEKVRRGRRECGKREGSILQILKYTSWGRQCVMWYLNTSGVGWWDEKVCCVCFPFKVKNQFY